MLNFFIFLVLSTALVDAAPHKSKYKKHDGPQMVYDQKQTGDYNIQLHLKDFQIVALLGDDVLGDYDYNYDYADFTVKPSGSTSTSTTPAPISNESPTSSTQKAPPTSSLSPPTTSSDPIKDWISDLLLPEDPVPVPPQKPSSDVMSNVPPSLIEETVNHEPSKKPSEENEKEMMKPNREDPPSTSVPEDSTQILETSLNEISSPIPSSSSQTPPTSSTNLPSISSTFSEPSSQSPESTPGKIKVKILEASSPMGSSTPAVGLVPGEDVQGDAHASILHGELASYRRCSSGYSRDKKGRCRRVRRPGVASQLPFGFGRLASNLATRLRLTNPEYTAEASQPTQK